MMVMIMIRGNIKTRINCSPTMQSIIIVMGNMCEARRARINEYDDVNKESEWSWKLDLSSHNRDTYTIFHENMHRAAMWVHNRAREKMLVISCKFFILRDHLKILSDIQSARKINISLKSILLCNWMKLLLVRSLSHNAMNRVSQKNYSAAWHVLCKIIF